ncbi:hypothetical protein F4780DRAFT_782440 [Xylariomycetidae sp. FL0641]|nr:hypothetical protein F4780DRAFT_782440 [Xylariomycetidae sp. FL0641]
MAAPMRICRPVRSATYSLRNLNNAVCRQPCIATRFATAPAAARSLRRPAAFLHTTPSRRKEKEEKEEGGLTDLDKYNVMADVPIPATSVDVCMSDGFKLNSGATTYDGAGVILINGEAFSWQPWLPRGEMKLLNKKGQWDVPKESLGLLSLLWPRPELLILGLGPEIRPISPDLKEHISSLGMKVEVLDTRNAAAQFNLLATERGVHEVAAAIIPIGWKEGVGANRF